MLTRRKARENLAASAQAVLDQDVGNVSPSQAAKDSPPSRKDSAMSPTPVDDLNDVPPPPKSRKLRRSDPPLNIISSYQRRNPTTGPTSSPTTEHHKYTSFTELFDQTHYGSWDDATSRTEDGGSKVTHIHCSSCFQRTDSSQITPTTEEDLATPDAILQELNKLSTNGSPSSSSSPLASLTTTDGTKPARFNFLRPMLKSGRHHKGAAAGDHSAAEGIATKDFAFPSASPNSNTSSWNSTPMSDNNSHGTIGLGLTTSGLEVTPAIKLQPPLSSFRSNSVVISFPRYNPYRMKEEQFCSTRPDDSRPVEAWLPPKRWGCCMCAGQTIVEQTVCSRLSCLHRWCRGCAVMTFE
jgi:hypothetical protein